MPNIFSKFQFFAFALLSNFRITLVGQIPVSELIALINSLSPKYWKYVLKLPDLRKINIAYFVFFLAQVLSDILNQSSLNNTLRGWANILMAIFVLNFVFTNYIKSPNYVIVFLVGYFFSLIIFSPDTFGSSIYEMSFFKFRVAPVLNILVLLLSYYLLEKRKVKSIFIIVLFITYGLINIALDSRSNGIFMILTGLIFYYRHNFRFIKSTKLVVFFVVCALLFQGLYSIYVYSVLNNHIGGEHSRIQMARVESPYNPINILKSGRAEVFVALYAIIDKPIFGHGSWAPDRDGKYTNIAFQLHDKDERFVSFFQSSDELIIPSHSILLGAWMTSGILGGISMLYIFLLFIKRSWSLIKFPMLTKDPLYPILIFFILSIFWNMLFSPLPHIRQTIPFQLSLILVLYHKINNRQFISKKQNNKIQNEYE